MLATSWHVINSLPIVSDEVTDNLHKYKLSNLKYISSTRALAEQELKTNIAETEVFVLPSGQQIQKEGITVHIYINSKRAITSMLQK